MHINQRQILSVFIVLVIAGFFSSFTFWLIKEWIKFPLFVFEMFASITVYLILINYDPKIFVKNSARIGRSLEIFTHICLVIFASILLTANTLNLEFTQTIFPLLLAFACGSLLSGYSLVTIFRLRSYFSRLEVVLLSFVLSFIFSGIVTLPLIWVTENVRSILNPLFYLTIGLISTFMVLRDFRREEKKSKELNLAGRTTSLARSLDILAILISIGFYVFYFLITYPNAALLPDSDISRHFGAAITLLRTPDFYSLFSYLLFHAFEGSIITLSGVMNISIGTFFSLLVTLNIFLPVAVYIVAKRFLENVDKRIPAIAVIFYTFLSNFSFIYYTQLNLIGTASNDIQFLLADKTYDSIINFLQPFSFFVPLSVSFIIFIFIFSLLKNSDMPRSRFIPLFTVLIFAMYLTHVVEAVIFSVFLAIYSLVSRKLKIRLDDALFSTLIAFVLIGMWFAYISLVWPSPQRLTTISIATVYPFAVPIVLVGGTMIWRKKILPKIKLGIKIKTSVGRRFYFILCTIIVCVYLFGFLTWFFIEDFRASSLANTGIVPWFIYPLLLGTVGLLGLLSVKYLNNIFPNSYVVILLSAAGFMFLLGRIISYSSLNFIIVSYWEKRLILIIFMFLSLLAPIPLIKFAERMNFFQPTKKSFFNTNNIALLVLVSIIIFSGFSSMVLQSDYWFNFANKFRIGEEEVQAVTFLKNELQRDPRSFTVALSPYSSYVTALAAPAYQLSLPQILVLSKYPDLPLLALSSHNLNHAYLYVHDRDLQLLNKQPENWLTQHLLRILPIIYSNENVTIFNASHVSYPLPDSDTHLIIPKDGYDNNWFYSYDIVSRSSKNYTAILDKDANALHAKTVILTFDPDNHRSFTDKFSPILNKAWTVAKGNWNPSTDGLHGGSNDSRALDNMLLSPVLSTARNLNASTSFRISNEDSQNANYASIVYSWIDPKNYDYGGLTVLRDKIYVSFVNVVNGTQFFSPPWPGLDTGIKFNPNERYELALNIQGNSREILLNGTRYFGDYSIRNQGYVGLSYGRIHDIIFDSFKIDECDNNEPQDLSSNYVKYVNDGGNLFVLNSNGYGSLADYLFNGSSSHSDFQTFKLVTVPNGHSRVTSGTNDSSNSISLTPNSNEVANLSHRSLQDQQNVFVLQTVVGKGKITYINIYPMISDFFDNKIPGSSLYSLYTQITDIIQASPIRSSPLNFKDISAIFRKMDGTAGNFEVNSTSLIFPTKIDTMKISGQHASNGTDFSIFNITNLHVDGYDRALLNSNTSYLLEGGKGLYSKLTLGDMKKSNLPSSTLSLEIFFKKNATISGTLGQLAGQTAQIYNVSKIHILGKVPISIYAREPIVRINNGDTTFSAFQSARLYPITGVSGQELRVNGNVSFSTYMTDSHTLASKFNFEGSTQRIPPMSQYNEFASLLPSISFDKLYGIPVFVRMLSLIPFLISAVFLVYVTESRRSVK